MTLDTGDSLQKGLGEPKDSLLRKLSDLASDGLSGVRKVSENTREKKAKIVIISSGLSLAIMALLLYSLFNASGYRFIISVSLFLMFFNTMLQSYRISNYEAQLLARFGEYEIQLKGIKRKIDQLLREEKSVPYLDIVGVYHQMEIVFERIKHKDNLHSQLNFDPEFYLDKIYDLKERVSFLSEDHEENIRIQEEKKIGLSDDESEIPSFLLGAAENDINSIILEDYDIDTDLYNSALELITSSNKASTSFLQRELKIGYNKAAEIIDLLEKQKIIGPSGPGGKRKIYL